MPAPEIRCVSVPGLDSRVRVFRCGRIVDAQAVVTDRFVVQIDTMISPETARQMLNQQEGELEQGRGLLVVNTHGDWDHCWGNALFDGPSAVYRAPILGHANTRRLFDQTLADSLLEESRVANPGWYESVQIRLPTVKISGETTIHGGDLTLELLPTPGHTPDHISVWIPELELLIAGDAAENPIPFVDERSSLPELRRSLERLRDLQPHMVLYSHGAGITSPDLIDHNIRYFDELERRCSAWLRTNRGEDAVDPLIRERIPFEVALPFGHTIEDDETRQFYGRSHERAVQAMVGWLISP